MLGFNNWMSSYVDDHVRDAKRAKLNFWQDNPYKDKKVGLDWLKSNKKAVTAGYRNVFVPVKELLKIPGEADEQKRLGSPVSQEKLSAIIQWLTQKGPKVLETAPPLITVDYTGKPKITEGNHRIIAAKLMGYHSIPIWVNYCGGSDQLQAKQIFDPINFH